MEFNINVPDDVATYLQSQGDVSTAAVEAVRGVLPETRRARQQAAAQVFGEYQRRRSAQQVEQERLAIEASNDIALHDSQW